MASAGRGGRQGSQRRAPGRSLKARALQLLAQREQSRAELRRKLLAAAQADDEAAAARRTGADGAAGFGSHVASGADADSAPGFEPGVGAGAHDSTHDSTHDNSADDSAEDGPTRPATSIAPEPAAAPARVDAVLDWLEAHGYLSDARFVESRVHAREARFGNLRIRQELKQHATVLPADLAAALGASELDRARALLARRFPTPGREAPAPAPAERARRARFLLGRGFSPEVVQRALRKAVEATDDDAAPSDG